MPTRSKRSKSEGRKSKSGSRQSSVDQTNKRSLAQAISKIAELNLLIENHDGKSADEIATLKNELAEAKQQLAQSRNEDDVVEEPDWWAKKREAIAAIQAKANNLFYWCCNYWRALPSDQKFTIKLISCAALFVLYQSLYNSISTNDDSTNLALNNPQDYVPKLDDVVDNDLRESAIVAPLTLECQNFYKSLKRSRSLLFSNPSFDPEDQIFQVVASSLPSSDSSMSCECRVKQSSWYNNFVATLNYLTPRCPDIQEHLRKIVLNAIASAGNCVNEASSTSPVIGVVCTNKSF